MSAGEADRLDPRVVGNGEESVCLTGLSTATRRESCGFASGCLHCLCCGLHGAAVRSCSRRGRPELALPGARAATGARHPLRAARRCAAAPERGQLERTARSSCRARPPTAAASSSTRTGSTTTAARSATRCRTIRAPRATSFSRSSGTYLYPTDTADVRQQRRRPRRAACRAARRLRPRSASRSTRSRTRASSARRSRSAAHRGRCAPGRTAPTCARRRSTS